MEDCAVVPEQDFLSFNGRGQLQNANGQCIGYNIASRNPQFQLKPVDCALPAPVWTYANGELQVTPPGEPTLCATVQPGSTTAFLALQPCNRSNIYQNFIAGAYCCEAPLLSVG